MNYPHWFFFVALVEDLEKSSRFVEFSNKNFETYSTEFSQLILSACSEIDVVAKLLCRQIDASLKPMNIDDYRTVILQHFKNLPSINIVMPRYGISLKPWDSWASGSNPKWWKSYNLVKHQRDKYFKSANLENTLNSIGGLAVLVSYLYHEQLTNNRLNPVPQFIFLDPHYNKGMVTHGQPWYRLPDFDPKFSKK